MNLKGTWVWVTGASSGLGLELAQQMATRGANLIISARRVDRLETLATELRTKGVEVQVLPADMSKPEDVERCLEVVKQSKVNTVILNAGVAHFGHFHELEWPAFQSMLQTNVVATTRLTNELVKHFLAKGTEARLMIVSSLTGLIPVPFNTAYSATKSFLVAYGMGLAHELKGTKVSVTVFAPGGIATEQTAGERYNSLRAWLAPVDAVALEALGALAARPSLHIQGFLNRVLLLLSRLVPRDVSMFFVSREYRKSLQRSLQAGEKRG